MVSAAEPGSSSTNKSSSSTTRIPSALSNLPPVTLKGALHTNVAGTYRLTPAWTGKCAVVHASGTFAQHEPAPFATNRYALKFDVAVVTSKTSVGNVGPHALARFDTNGGFRALHTFRDSLPADSKIKAAASMADLQGIVGAPHGFAAPTGYGPEPRNRLEWSFFSVNPEGTLETLQVTALVAKRPRPKDAHVESLEILRGNLRAEPTTN